MSFTKKLISMTIFLIAISVGAGCASYTSIPKVAIKQPGVTIKAEDGSFVLQSGKRFKTPFSYRHSISSLVQTQRPLVESWERALQYNAGKKVRVKVEGQKKELYGVIAFGSVRQIKQCSGPALRSHLIDIGSEYINAAKGGNISVIFETYECRGRPGPNYNWMLWMSDTPFA